MNCFFKKPGSSGAPSSELKAILFALAASFLFIGFLTAANRSRPGKHRYVIGDRSYKAPPPPVRPVQVPEVVTEVPAPPPPPDLNQQFRYAKMFSAFDFRNRSYGKYILSDGKEVDLALINGQFRQYGTSAHWFDLNDVFYTDVTGDGQPEAIALLTHLECSSSACDGGKSLVYIYSLNYGLNEVLTYESGSGMDGCSLKSLIVKNRQVTLELFGKCPQTSTTPDDHVRRETYDLTRIDFRFNGKQLVPRNPTYVTVPDCGEVTSGVQVRISDERSPVEATTTRKPCV